MVSENKFHEILEKKAWLKNAAKFGGYNGKHIKINLAEAEKLLKA